MNSILEGILDGYHDEMIENLQKLIRIQSVVQPESFYCNEEAPFGEKMREALDFVLDLGREKGFECVNYGNRACEIHFGSGEESVGAALHLDVVPASDKGWSFDPFGGEIKNGKIYGRGAADDKGPLIAAFYACLAIKESGLPVSKSIKQIIGCAEETGTFPCIQYYLQHAKNLPESGIVPDSWFPCVFSEKDILNYSFRKIFEDAECQGRKITAINGGEAVNMVPAYARAEFDNSGDGEEDVIICKGKTAHASTPDEGDNAISGLLNALQNESFGPAEVKNILNGIAPYLDVNGAGFGVQYTDDTGSFTNNLGLIRYDGKVLELCFNARIPVSFGIENVEKKLSEAAAEFGMEYIRSAYSEHYYMSRDNETMKTLINVYRRETGDMESQPKAIGVGSYARILSGFIPFGPAFQGEEYTLHKEDEYIRIDRLMQASKIYAQALYELAE
ncbi:MAG: Sapep family Mn(2+)-dependent dipeptidase [Lentihominibacter sp.]